MISRPNGSVQVRCAPSAEVNRPSAVPYSSSVLVAPTASSNHLRPPSSRRNCRPMPSDTMMDGMIRLATVT
ncbi:hypothetical protein Y695_02777 [Hydrogenophaga sp. T4]|nr:hypothetical protein Y695_02777 [Hydrogenophaga sp. T4]